MEGHREGWSASHVSKPGPVVTTKTRVRATTGIHSKGIRDSLWRGQGRKACLFLQSLGAVTYGNHKCMLLFTSVCPADSVQETEDHTQLYQTKQLESRSMGQWPSFPHVNAQSAEEEGMHQWASLV